MNEWIFFTISFDYTNANNFESSLNLTSKKNLKKTNSVLINSTDKIKFDIRNKTDKIIIGNTCNSTTLHLYSLTKISDFIINQINLTDLMYIKPSIYFI